MPAPLVKSNAVLKCTMGLAPAKLTVLPDAMVMAEGQPLAAIDDSAAMVNVPPFGMCTSLANPAVASATSAAQGVLTPQPCTPQPTPWTPGTPLVLVGGKPAVNATCTATCAFGGLISVTMPGTTRTLG